MQGIKARGEKAPVWGFFVSYDGERVQKINTLFYAETMMYEDCVGSKLLQIREKFRVLTSLDVLGRNYREHASNSVEKNHESVCIL
jgi:hypothetical protein